MDLSEERLKPIAQAVMCSTPPLFCLKNNDIEMVSSAILLKWRLNHYLITAAHTLREFRQAQLGLLVNHRHWTIGGWKAVTEGVSADKIDIGIYHLSNEFIDAIKPGYAFIDLESINLNESNSQTDQYLVAGHAINRTKVNPYKHQVEQKPFLLLTTQDITLHSKTETRPDVNMILNYPKSDLQNLSLAIPVHGPDPRGISGCGIWCWREDEDTQSIKYSLAGILIEYFAEHHCLIGTQLSVVTELLRQHFDNTIPKSNGPQIRTHLL